MNKILFKIDRFIDNNKKLVILLLFFPHIYHIGLPSGSIDILEFLFSRLRLLSLVILFFLFIYRQKKPSKFLISVSIFCFVVLLSTVINNIQNINKAILFISSYLAIILLIDIFIDDIKSLIKALLIGFEIQIYPNLITVLLYRNVDVEVAGYNMNNFFLGTANDLILYLLPAFFLSVLYIKEIKLSIRPVLLIAVTLTSSLLIKSLTTVASLLVFAIVFGYCVILKKNNIRKANLIMCVPFLAYLIVVLPYVVYGENPIIKFMFDNIYYNHSFECRTCIWASSKDYIINKPILGYGHYYNDFIMIGNENDIYNLAHNTLLQTILNYGFIGLFLFLLFNTIIIQTINKMNNNFYKSFFISIMCGILITFITQDYHRFFDMMVIYSIINNLNKIE